MEMISNRNHEGYHDPTACIAIRRADRRKNGVRRNTATLTYQMEEMQVFQRVKVSIQR
ncbi:MAG: hypothetical protein ACI4DX_06130 [Oliverpabstia sp.]